MAKQLIDDVTAASIASAYAAPIATAIANLTRTALASRSGTAGAVQFADGCRWVWSATGAANGGLSLGTVVEAAGGGFWNRELSGLVIDSAWFVTPNTGLDVRTKLQAFLDFCAILKLAGILRKGEYDVSADPASPNASVCIALPDGLLLTVEPGHLIKGVNGLSSWARIVSCTNANVRVIGELMIDGNVGNISATNNEHMHGLIVYGGNVTIDAVNSQNCRGDNVSLTGDVTNPSIVNIGRITATKAGRKNLVLGGTQADITVANLDNRLGGARAYGGVADNTDGHSLDVEPDNYAGEVLLSRIGTLTTQGSGNDFSSVNTLAGRNYRVEIGQLDATITPRTYGNNADVLAWIHYGVTVQAKNITMRGLSKATDFLMRYAGACLIAETVTLNGSVVNNLLMSAQASAGGRPQVTIGTLTLNNPVGWGAQLDGAHAEIGTVNGNTPNGLILAVRETLPGTETQNVLIQKLNAVDSGGNQYYAAFSTVVAGRMPRVRINQTTATDSRALNLRPPRAFIIAGSGETIMLPQIDIPAGMLPVLYDGTETFYKQSTNVYRCAGVPVHAAESGSIALRSDGGAGSSYYVREGAAWVAK